jgi:hypothetical protein
MKKKKSVERRIGENQPTLQLDDDLYHNAANASLYETPKKLQHFLEIPKQ